MPSFDIVSQVNSMEIENAVNQAKKELANRFDFKGSKAEIVLEKDEIRLTAEDQFKIQALGEIMMSKLAKRNISLKNVEREDAYFATGSRPAAHQDQTGSRAARGQTDHRFHPGRKIQGDHSDPGQRSTSDSQKSR